jgi:hypothetical protein
MAGKSFFVLSVVHVSEILRAFRSRTEALRLRGIVDRTVTEKTITHRRECA